MNREDFYFDILFYDGNLGTFLVSNVTGCIVGDMGFHKKLRNIHFVI